MRQISVLTPAKINLSLDVTGRRSDGYHLLSSIMQSIDLADRVTVETNHDRKGIRLACSQGGLPLDQRNTAWRAAAYYLEAASLGIEVHIEIIKHIPSAAGLAGGSADAAAVLFALDMLFPDFVQRPMLFEIAAKIGADVPFCLQGGTVLCEGIGEKLTLLHPFDEIPLILCKPDFNLRTVWVYQQLDALAMLDKRPDQAAIMDALARRDLTALSRSTANVLEAVSLKAYPVLANLKNSLFAAGASAALMSGSGPTVYGLFESLVLRNDALHRLAGQVPGGTLVLPAMTLAYGPRPVYNNKSREESPA